jgi:hypothetical protein
MNETPSFAERVRERFPEGLTGIIAIGGTRTTFILDYNRNQTDPGYMPDFTAYGDRLLDRYHELISMFLALGGQNLIMPVLAWQRFSEKGQEYAEAVAMLLDWLSNEKSVAFYKSRNIDPYFAGIDTLLHLPEDHFGHQAAQRLTAFQKGWDYQEGRHKLVWEVAPIPLFSVLRAHKVLGEEALLALEAEIAATDDLAKIDDLTYRYYAKALYGTEVPMPHFYLGSNRKGDLKLRSMLPFALYSGAPMRLYFTPYPSLFTQFETLQNIIDDLAFGKQKLSREKDYRGQLTPEAVQTAYQNVMQLSSDASTTVGLLYQPAKDARD